ncbi:MAG TPA: VOC family protein [Caulobacteraceae bacterium]
MNAVTRTDAVPTQAKAKGGATVYLHVDGAAKAADFYSQAFGAELAAMNPLDENGRTMHVHLYVNGSSVMLSDYYPEHGHAKQTPAGFTMILHVDDIDRWYKRAVDAGATVGQPVTEMFWGDRYGSVKDPYGFEWAMNQAKAG